LQLRERFKNIKSHEYIVMPNHFHSILEISVGATLVVPQNADNGVVAQKGQPQGVAPTTGIHQTVKTVGDMVGAFQSIVTVKYIHGVKKLNWKTFHQNRCPP
jgi:putative transposase